MTITDQSTPITQAKAKSIFASKTFWGAVLTLLIAVSPEIGKNIDDYRKSGNINATSITQIIVIFGTTLLTIMGRIDAKEPVYTPNGLPGPNKSEFHPEQ